MDQNGSAIGDGDTWWYVCTLCYQSFSEEAWIKGHKRAWHPGSAAGLKNVLVLSQLVDLQPKIRVHRSRLPVRKSSSELTFLAKHKKRKGSRNYKRKLKQIKRITPKSQTSHEAETTGQSDDINGVHVKVEIPSDGGNEISNHDDSDWCDGPDSPDTDPLEGLVPAEGTAVFDVTPVVVNLGVVEVDVKTELDPELLGFSPGTGNVSEAEPPEIDFDNGCTENECTDGPKPKRRRRRKAEIKPTTKAKKVGKTKTVKTGKIKIVKTDKLQNKKAKIVLTKTKSKLEKGKLGGRQPAMCPICRNVFLDNTVLKSHHQEVHGGARVALCAQCGAAFKHERHLREHYRTHDPDNYKHHVCKVCSKTFYTSYLLRRHGSVHRAPSLACPIAGCDRLFKDGTSLIIHTRKAHGEDRPYKCERCEASFKLIAGLQLHSSTMHRDGAPDSRLYSCPKCSETFENPPDLRAHVMSMHREGKSGSVLHKCRTCGLQLPDMESLKCHELEVHDYQRGTRRFECSFCSKRYANLCYLQRHELGHSQQTATMDQQFGSGISDGTNQTENTNTATTETTKLDVTNTQQTVAVTASDVDLDFHMHASTGDDVHVGIFG